MDFSYYFGIVKKLRESERTAKPVPPPREAAAKRSRREWLEKNEKLAEQERQEAADE